MSTNTSDEISVTSSAGFKYAIDDRRLGRTESVRRRRFRRLEWLIWHYERSDCCPMPSSVLGRGTKPDVIAIAEQGLLEEVVKEGWQLWKPTDSGLELFKAVEAQVQRAGGAMGTPGSRS